ncbi:MAG: hypothetical protein R3F02_11560 [Thiolinea sp.]
MSGIIKSSLIVITCALGLAACNTNPHHVSTSGALYLNVGNGHSYHKNKHRYRPYVRPSVRYHRPVNRVIVKPVIRHDIKKHRGHNVRNHRPYNNDRCGSQRHGGKYC